MKVRPISIFTVNNRNRGEIAVRYMSDKAIDFYNNNEITVYEYINYDIEPETSYLYAVCIEDQIEQGLTFEECDALLCVYDDCF